MQKNCAMRRWLSFLTAFAILFTLIPTFPLQASAENMQTNGVDSSYETEEELPDAIADSAGAEDGSSDSKSTPGAAEDAEKNSDGNAEDTGKDLETPSQEETSKGEKTETEEINHTDAESNGNDIDEENIPEAAESSLDAENTEPCVSGYIDQLSILDRNDKVTETLTFTEETSEYHYYDMVIYDVAEVGVTFTGVSYGETVGKLYCNYRVDGEQTTYGAYKTDKLLSRGAQTIWFNFMLDRVEYGEHDITINVGQRLSNKTLKDPAVYHFHITYLPSFRAFSFTDADGTELVLSPEYESDSAQTTYLTSAPSDTIKIDQLSYSSSNGIKVLIGDNEWTGATTEILLSDYEETETSYRVPFTLVAGAISRTITLEVTKPDKSPKVKNQLPSFSCEKNEAKTVNVEVEDAEKFNLSYQWYKGDTAGTLKIIEGETEASYTIPTTRAGSWFYNCVVTNTENGTPYRTVLEPAKFEVKLTSVNEPTIIKQPGTYSIQKDQEIEYRTKYVQGERFDPMYIRMDRPEAGVTYDFKFYRNDSVNGTAEIPGKLENLTEFPTQNDYDDYVFTSDISLELGSNFIYCIVTAISEEDASKTNAVSSKLVKLTSDRLKFSMEGSGTEDSPYIIMDVEDFEEIRAYVNSGENLYGVYFQLGDDIELPDKWEPIGCTKDGSRNEAGDNLNPFSGNIDGNGKTITIPKDGLPLLKYVNNATVRNLNIFGERIASFGLVERFTGVGLSGSAIVIDNVTLKEGTSTLYSGFIGSVAGNGFAGASAGFEVTIQNCTVEKGVTIGYDGNQSNIGSFAGRINGTVENCVSYATVNGDDYVGGILGTRDNSVGTCTVSNCKFYGDVNATGSYVGGIVGGGYGWNSTAPNAYRVTVQGCTASGNVQGDSCVGGIIGGDQFVACAWNDNSVNANHFSGKVVGNKYVGGIIGYYRSINNKDHIEGNTFTAERGAENGIGYIGYIDTSYTDPAISEGGVSFSTEESIADCPYVYGCYWMKGSNRTDDPLGKDADKLCRKVGSGEVVKPSCIKLTIGGKYKTEYTIGDALNLTGIQLTAEWTDGTTSEVALKDVTIEGYDKDTVGEQTVSLRYSSAVAYITVTVKPVSAKITVSVTIMGDSKHGSTASPHGLARGGLSTWVSESNLEADTTETVWDVLQRVGQKKNVTFSAGDDNQYNTVYISAVNGLGEFDNGPKSGWMYTVNGSHPNVGVSAKYLSNGDNIILHYTDDFDYEEGGVKYGQPVEDTSTAKAVIDLIDKIGNVTYTDECKQKIDAARKAYDDLSQEEKDKVTNYKKLTDAEKKYADLKLADDKAKAKKVDDLISKIGTVTINSGAAINAAWDVYNDLTLTQKSYVTKLSTLQEATRKWNQLKADEVIKLIDKIDDPVTEKSKAGIDAARKAYDALTKDQKNLVTNVKKLTDAEAAYAKLTATPEDKDKAQEVIDKIKKLGDITLDSEKDIEAARKAYDALTDLQKKLVENYDVLTTAEAKLAILKTLGKVSNPYITTGDYMEKLGTPSVGTVGGEWMVIGLARSGRTVPGEDTYYQGAVQYVQQTIDKQTGRLHKAKSTDNSRMILALTALGKDVTNVGGHNLLQGLSDLDYVKYQGNNGPIWALLALDSGNYPAPSGGTTTRQALIEEILRVQTSDGGWAISGDKADSDMTGMALTALAPYYKKDLKVQAAIDKAVARLSEMQDADGGFSTSYGDGKMVATSESISQVVTALSALGINADTDPRFIKDGGSAIDALLRYYVSGGGFRHVMDGAIDGMGTEQAYYALTAYYRFLTGKTNLYDMTDVIDMGGDPVEIPTEPTVPATTEPTEVEPAKTGFPWWILVICVVGGCGLGMVIAIIIIPKFGKFKKKD